MLADVVTYNRREDTVTATGNISLVEPTGEVIFADRVELSGDLRNGIIENMRVRLSDDARIAAPAAAGSAERRLNSARPSIRHASFAKIRPGHPYGRSRHLTLPMTRRHATWFTRTHSLNSMESRDVHPVSFAFGSDR